MDARMQSMDSSVVLMRPVLTGFYIAEVIFKYYTHQLFEDSKRIDTKHHLSCNANVIFNVSLQMIHYYLFHPSQRLQKMLPSVRIMWIAMVYSMQE